MSKKKINTMEIAIKTSEELNNLSETELDKYVQECSVKILEKISISEEKIKKAEYRANEAKNMAAHGAKEHLKNFFTGGNYTRDKKANATAEGLVKTNEAIAEMNDLMQEIIGFVCLSLRFAQKMNESINHMIEVGFTGRDGQFHELTEDSKKIARKVLQESSKYAQTQIENELRHKQQDEKIKTISELATDNESRLNKKDIIDAEQTKRLEELGAILDNKDLVDQRQEEAINKNTEAIKVLFEYTKQKDILDKEQSEEIENIKKTSSKRFSLISIIISSVAIIFSIVNIILFFIK